MSILDTTIEKIKNKTDEACELGEINSSERVLSLVAGGFILFYSAKKLFKRPFTAFGGITLGSALIGRGLTGKCPLKGTMREANPTEDQEVTMIERRYFSNK